MHHPDGTPAPVAGGLYIARQPIFAIDGGLHGYELLYRQGPTVNAPGGIADDEMSSEVLVNAFLTVGIGRLTGRSRAFVNFTRRLLLDRVYTVLHREQVVIELLERVGPDPEVIAACRDLVQQGYTLALDDFTPSPAMEPLLDLAGIVKLDVLGRSRAELEEITRYLRRWPVQLLAERVETAEVRATCRDLGFSYVQGYFFARPEIVRHRSLPTSPAAIVRLLSLVRGENTGEVDIERAMQGNVALTVKLLRAANSAAIGGRGVTSIRHAIRLLGHGELARWLSLMLVTSFQPADAVDAELINVVLRRARMCEDLARRCGRERQADGAFIVGLFSLLDAVLKTPMPDLLAGLNLTPELNGAIVRRAGDLGQLLTLIELFERGAWDDVIAEATSLHLEVGQLNAAYADGLGWAARRLEEPDMAG